VGVTARLGHNVKLTCRCIFLGIDANEGTGIIGNEKTKEGLVYFVPIIVDTGSL
jgi:hypothetical protein